MPTYQVVALSYMPCTDLCYTEALDKSKLLFSCMQMYALVLGNGALTAVKRSDMLLDRHRCLLCTHVDKLRLLETFKNKLHHAKGHSYVSCQASLTSIHAAMAENQTAQKVQTDRQTAFQLYKSV